MSDQWNADKPSHQRDARVSGRVKGKCGAELERKAMDFVDPAALTNDGERVIVGNMLAYWAHLSIYHFALPLAVGRSVLDAGSGAGYGAAYLARHGAAGVLALDAGHEAVEHSRRRYAGDAVTYEVADLNERLPVGDRVYGLVFSSNVFEHVGNVDGLAAECARVVADNGAVIVAVPPIISAEVMALDIGNRFHVHHIPPSAWQAKLQRFFSEVRCYAHRGRGEFASKEREWAEIMTPPDRVTIRETDFEFPEIEPSSLQDSITAVFVCRKPRGEQGAETLAERTPAAWREGEMAARAIAAEHAAVNQLREQVAAMRGGSPGASGDAATLEQIVAVERATVTELRRRVVALEAELSEMQTQSPQLAFRVAALESSTSWRITAPMRAIAGALRLR
jgi:2-polyprenyl-3-methyl-5-hydroxy-6-metoxy-1,4-benzoquinol methylase